LPIDRGLRRERGADVAPRVLRVAVLFDAKHHLARDAPDCQIANDIDLVTRSWLDARADETQFGILRGVEEIRRLEMSIAVRHACLDARGVDRHRDGGLGEVAVRYLHGPRPPRERPAHLRDHQVPHRKVQARMAAVDLPTLCAHKSSSGCARLSERRPAATPVPGPTRSCFQSFTWTRRLEQTPRTIKLIGLTLNLRAFREDPCAPKTSMFSNCCISPRRAGSSRSRASACSCSTRSRWVFSEKSSSTHPDSRAHGP